VERARRADGWIVDANFAYPAMAAASGRPDPNARADAFCPADLADYAAIHGTSLEVSRR
jgi:hypothetical protein